MIYLAAIIAFIGIKYNIVWMMAVGLILCVIFIRTPPQRKEKPITNNLLTNNPKQE